MQGWIPAFGATDDGKTNHVMMRVEGYWGGTKELFVSRVGRNKVVINVVKKGGDGYLEAPAHMMNTKVKMTTIKYTVLGQ